MGRMKYTEEERSRIMISFIQATRKIIDTEGIDQVSIRKIANQTGMNSATMYRSVAIILNRGSIR